MQIESPEWIAILVLGAAEMGVRLTEAQARQMQAHAALLMTWNRKVNLTAITVPEDVAVKHYLDAIGPSAHIPDAGPLLDIGTGGGFPGIPLKIMRPGQPMTLIDGSRKKISFIKQVIRQLQLPRTEAIQVRAEALGLQPTYRGRFAVIVARALADMNTIVRMARPLLAPGGNIFLYKGPSAETGLSTPGEPDTTLPAPLATKTYRLPLTKEKRVLIVVPDRPPQVG